MRYLEQEPDRRDPKPESEYLLRWFRALPVRVPILREYARIYHLEHVAL